jgi:hypothetical protein
MILHEIHQILHDNRTLGIGRVKFVSSQLNVLNPEMAGYIVRYDNIDYSMTGTS